MNIIRAVSPTHNEIKGNSYNQYNNTYRRQHNNTSEINQNKYHTAVLFILVITVMSLIATMSLIIM